MNGGFVQELKRQHKGPDVAYRLGLKLYKSGARYFVLCPFHSEKTASCHIFNEGFHCFGCGEHGDTIRFIQEVLKCDFREAVSWLDCGQSTTPVSPDHKVESNLRIAERIWNEAHRITSGSKALRYFQNRGLQEKTIIQARSVRFHPNLDHSETESKHPAVVFLLERFSSDNGEVQDPQPDAIAGIHRIYLSDDCTKKLESGTSKKLLGSPAGAGIWLDCPSEIMCVAEGPENALTIRQAFGFNTVCGISASNLGNLAIPPCVRELHVFPDADDNGRKALNTLAKRVRTQIYAKGA